MNQKIVEIEGAIARTNAKIENLQKLSRELESKKTEFEESEIFRLMRSITVTPEELESYIEQLKQNRMKEGELSEN